MRCWKDSRVHDGKGGNTGDWGIEIGNRFRYFDGFGIGRRNGNRGRNWNRIALKWHVLGFTGNCHSLLFSLSVWWVFLRESPRIHVYFVLSNLIHFAVDMRRRSLTVAHATTNARTSWTLKTRIVCGSNNAKFTLQLLQTEDPWAVSALDTAKSLSTLYFTTQVTRLDSLMTGLFCRFHIHSVWKERTEITHLPQNDEPTIGTVLFSTRLRIQT